MPNNPFRSKPGSKKLNEPTSICPLLKGEIKVEVNSFDPRTPANTTPLPGVGITVTGGSGTIPAKTAADGKWRFQPLTPGPGYTVTPAFTAEQNDKYDTALAVAVNQAVVAGTAPTVVFLVPSTWVEFMVRGTALVPQPLANIPWTLERQPIGGMYSRYDAGNTGANGHILRLGVGTGQHRLTVRELTNPAWSTPEAVIGTSVTLTTDVLGFAAGELGLFEILERENLNAVLEILAATVKVGPNGLRLEGSWKPTEASMAALKRSQIVFRASAMNAVLYSDPITLKKRETVKFLTTRGVRINRQLTLRFVSGNTMNVTTAGGEVEVLVPWAETLLGVSFPGLAASRIKVEGIGVVTV